MKTCIALVLASAVLPMGASAATDGTISTPWGGPLSISFLPDDATKPEGPGRLTQVYQRMDLRWCEQIAKVAPTYDGFQSLSVNGGGTCIDRPDNTVEVVSRTTSRP